VEPFAGAASVLLRKSRSPLEVYNDLNGEVVNFFRVLREQADELVRLLYLTPWSRAEYELSLDVDPALSDVERARRFYVSAWMGFGGGRARWRQGWRYQVRSGWKASAKSFTELDHLYQIVERLRGVQIECRDAFDVLRSYDALTTLFYLDPPYVHSSRSKWTDIYAVEMSDDDHVELATLARSLEGMVLVSGYPSELYAECYEAHGWCRVETQARTNGGGAISSAARIEALWLSPRVQDELERASLPLFGADIPVGAAGKILDLASPWPVVEVSDGRDRGEVDQGADGRGHPPG
jgi:DNA adenine methylase